MPSLVRADGRILGETEAGVGLITLNQPERLNALSVAMIAGLAEILDVFEADPAVQVVVLTGAGPRAFSAGADLTEFAVQRGDAEAERDYDRMIVGQRQRLAHFSKPTIARVRGYCLGGGLGLALQCDLRIAAEDSEFAIPAVRYGYASHFDFVQRLVGLVGPAQARQMLFTGTRIDATEAARIGLVNRTVRDEDLSDTVVDLARSIADNAPLSLRAAKLAVEQATHDPEARDIAAVEAAVAACFDSADYREGCRAALEKRAPRFAGG